MGLLDEDSQAGARPCVVLTSHLDRRKDHLGVFLSAHPDVGNREERLECYQQSNINIPSKMESHSLLHGPIDATSHPKSAMRRKCL